MIGSVEVKVKELRDLLKVERITDDMDVILFNGASAAPTTEPDFDVVEIRLCGRAGKECIVITPGDEINIEQL